MKQGYIKFDDLRDWRLYACDFETTTSAVSEDHTKVWSFCLDEVGKYDPIIYESIDGFFSFCTDITKGYQKRLYFHNLKFDGNFILWSLVNTYHYKTFIDETGEMGCIYKLLNGEMVYCISDSGAWYYLAFKMNNILIEIRDSLKILPMSLKDIGNSFCQRFKKSEMNYDNKTSLEDCTKEDIEYIKNDVLVLSEALSFILQLNGEESPFMPVQSLTIGSASLQEFKRLNYGENKNIFPRLETELLPDEMSYKNFEEYIRAGYRGGYCYVQKAKQGKTINEKGFTADVNSLYPFSMCYEYSGNRFPYGKGIYRTGKPPIDREESEQYYFYIRVKVSFILRNGYVPTIQKKHTLFYKQNVYLESSAIMDFATGLYKGKPLKIEMVFSKDDWVIFQEHYKILEIEYLDYIEFMTGDGIFDEFIKKFAKIKQETTGASRKLAKLIQNSLYGKTATSTNSSFKILTGEDQSVLNFGIVAANSKKPLNIAIGACITAKARRYQIETIQNNYERFCYSDTDSLHCTGNPNEFNGKVDDKIYGAYKIEAEWIKARYVRQKTYIEILKNGDLNICACGMTDAQKEWFRNNKSFDDFNIGLSIPNGKLKPKLVEGGVILEEVGFTMV